MFKIFLYTAIVFATSVMAIASQKVQTAQQGLGPLVKNAKTENAENAIEWAKDFSSGIEQAQTEDKPVLFVFSNHGCKYCVILEKTTFKNSDVIKGLNKDFVSIIAYSDERDAMPRELWRPGTPTIWFLLPNGAPMFQPLMGAVDAENFLHAMAIVKKEFDTKSMKKTDTKSGK